jgi:hypothetical protein
LALDREKRNDSDYDSYDPCDEQPNVREILRRKQAREITLRVILGPIALGGGCLLLYYAGDDRHRGRRWGYSGVGMVLVAAGLGGFFAPVYWQTCQEQSEHRQTFQHDGGNVSQISVLRMASGGRIASMGFFGRHLHEGVTHLTWAVCFKLIGVDALISSGLTLANGQIEHGTPLPFSWRLFGALFLGLVIFYAATMRFRIPPKVKIHSAEYGNSPDNAVTVEKYLKAYPKNAIVLQVDNNVLDGLPDPAPKILPKKTLTVRYSFGNNTVWETSAEEGELIALPARADRRKKIS